MCGGPGCELFGPIKKDDADAIAKAFAAIKADGRVPTTGPAPDGYITIYSCPPAAPAPAPGPAPAPAPAPGPAPAPAPAPAPTPAPAPAPGKGGWWH